MEYYVVMPDGSKYGPATLDTLNEWAQQGRILSTTTIERVSDGAQEPASQIPGLVLPSLGGSSEDNVAGKPSAPSFGPQPCVPQPSIGQPAPGQETFSGYPRQQEYNYEQLPYELQGKFNWGAFLLTWIWGLNHKAYITLISLGLGFLQFGLGFLIWPRAAQSSSGPNPVGGMGFNPFDILLSLAGLGLAIFYGIKGYEWAWKSGRFATPEECRRCQTIWGWWGLGFILAVCACGILIVIGGILALANMGSSMSR